MLAIISLVAAAPAAAVALRPGVSVRTLPSRMSVSDTVVAEALDGVPVFGILLSESGKLYTEEGHCMVYTHLADASRVLGRMQGAYPAEEFEIMPLTLGGVLTESGLLGEGSAAPPKQPLRVNLVASPEERQAARKIREDGCLPKPKRRRGAAGRLQEVPIFHIGAIETSALDGGEAATLEDDEAANNIWPFFFRATDVDTMWQQLGAGRPLPEVRVSDLAALVDGLREADALPDAKPMICAPLDALDFLRATRDKTRAMQDSTKPRTD